VDNRWDLVFSFDRHYILLMSTKDFREVGLKITSAHREYYRYTGVSAEVQRHGFRGRHPDFTRLSTREQGEQEDRPDLQTQTSKD
jgi:hypothetical protein